MELIAYKGINDFDFNINYWRTKNGLEVDFILGQGEIAVEVKISDNVNKNNLQGMMAFIEEHNPKQAIVVSLDTTLRKLQTPNGNEILVMPYKLFLKKLWHKKIIV